LNAARSFSAKSLTAYASFKMLEGGTAAEGYREGLTRESRQV